MRTRMPPFFVFHIAFTHHSSWHWQACKVTRRRKVNFFFKKQIHISFSRLFIVVVLCLVVCYLPFVALISLLPRAQELKLWVFFAGLWSLLVCFITAIRLCNEDYYNLPLFLLLSTTMASSSLVNANASANTLGSNALCVVVGMTAGYGNNSNVLNNLAT